MNTRHDISYRVKEAARNLCRHAGELAYDLSRMFFRYAALYATRHW